VNPSIQLRFEGGLLRVLTPADIHPMYISGLNDPQVNRYLDVVKRIPQTLESVCEFVRSNLEAQNGLLLGIWLDGETQHCGTLRIHGIDSYHRTAYVGICLFDRSVWGKRIGTKAIHAATEWALKNLDLRWMEAGAFEQNIASQKAFLAAGYDWVFDIREKLLLEGNAATVKVFAARRSKD
jgi:ribosomal-protein-alanine N-acetyltransferase